MTNLNEYDDSHNACETTAEIIPFRPARGSRHWSSWIRDCRPVKLDAIPASRSCMYAVLSCLGQHADKNGLSWPAVSTIAEIIGYSERQVRYGMRALEAQGFVQRIERKTRGGRKKPTNGTNHYRLVDDPHAEIGQPTHDDLELFAHPPPCNPLHPPPAKGCTPPLQRVAAKESIEGLKEEKGETKISADASDRRPQGSGVTFEVWEAYSAAYFTRYGVDPVRNGKVNGQLAQLVTRLGKEEAPQVAAFFLGHNDQWYLKNAHAVGCLLSNAEALRTQWATNRKITSTAAQQADRFSSNMEAAKEAMRIRGLAPTQKQLEMRVQGVVAGTYRDEPVSETPAQAETPDCLHEVEAEPSETYADIEKKIADCDKVLSPMTPLTAGYDWMMEKRAGHVAKLGATEPPLELMRTGT